MFNNTTERGARHNNAVPIGQPGVTYGESPASGPAPTTAGHHTHDAMNKLDPRVDSTQDRMPMPQRNNGVPEGTYGPHRSRIANALDPRVDSDMDGSGPNGTMHGGAGPAGTRRTAGTAANVPEGTYGPHQSRTANALDPTVDSDMDHRRTTGAASYNGGVGRTAGPAYGAGQSSGVGGRYGAQQQQQQQQQQQPMVGSGTTAASGGAGPHKSSLLNKLDPRVDSKTGAVYENGAQRRY
ncbi:hypothetical protein B0T24DRAFT_222265 [Lasiosphaeria ovina]|uniref:Cell surface protein n=1 Tax=Lasiosphaeria ovina TaxID=92902 RepID=A0AAE0NBI3_9PEZI|nr:hypothetical protein B0T24DRAFT_222265 [Lasiosphaeria ovina]